MSQTDTMSKKRITRILIIALIIAALLVLRVFYLQVVMAGWLKKSAEDQRFRAVKVLPRRGTIYDRFGEVLATSNDGESVYVVPKEVGIEVATTNNKGRKIFEVKNDNAQRQEIANIIGNTLSLDVNKVKQILDRRSAAFVWLKRKTTYEEIDKLRKVLDVENKRIDGIYITVNPQRFYPQGSFAAQLLGDTGIDNQGLEGLEKYLDVYLQGVPGSDQAEYDTMGRHIPEGNKRYLEPIPGDSVYLTIDHNIQYIAERELEIGVEENKAKRGIAIIANPQTGELLAVANYPKFDPNNFTQYPVAYRRNGAFCDMYEPGSTFKIITSIAALEEGKVTADSTFDDPGYLMVDRQAIHCWKPGGHGHENFVQALENSCNPVFAALGLRLGKEMFYKYIDSFGFGKLTNVDFPGESPGQLKSLSGVRNFELANIGFGQGISVTPIQMVMAACAVANGGYMLKPQLIKEIRSADGKVKRGFQRQVVKQVVSTQTANTLSKMLESVVTNGSGIRAYLEGYRVAGKTGTAEKVVEGTRGYSQIISSFLGFAPANNPQLLGIVILDEPGDSSHFGGVIAAPVFGNMFRDALRYLEVSPQPEPNKSPAPSVEDTFVPNVISLTPNEAITAIKQKQLDVRVVGQGNVVLDQVPKYGAKVQPGTKIILYLEPSTEFRGEQNKIILPNFLGLSILQVQEEFNKLGLKMDARGTGIAVSQTPSPGTAVDSGSIIHMIFKGE